MKQRLLLSLFLICSISSVFSQQLFMPKAANVDFENNTEVKKIVNRTTTNSVVPIELDLEQIVKQQNLTITINNDSYSLFPMSVDVRGINNFTATYRSDDRLNTMVISIYGDDVKGHLFLENGIWNIETIDTNQYVLVNIDQSAFPDEKDVSHEIEIKRQKNGNVNDVNMVEMIPHPIISVLVLYTNDALYNHSNVVNEVFAAEGMANAAFENSDIDCKLKVVYVGHTDYDEFQVILT